VQAAALGDTGLIGLPLQVVHNLKCHDQELLKRVLQHPHFVEQLRKASSLPGAKAASQEALKAYCTQCDQARAALSREADAARVLLSSGPYEVLGLNRADGSQQALDPVVQECSRRLEQKFGPVEPPPPSFLEQDALRRVQEARNTLSTLERRQAYEIDRVLKVSIPFAVFDVGPAYAR